MSAEGVTAAPVKIRSRGSFEVARAELVQVPGDDRPPELRRGGQIESCGTRPWATLDAITRGDAAAMNDRQLAGAAAQLVALGACDRACFATCRRAYAVLATTSPSAGPLFLDPAGDGGGDRYVFDRETKAFVRASDGLAISSKPDWMLLRRSLSDARHRNGTAHRETILVEAPLALALARESAPCRACGASCDRLMPTVLPGGGALMTPDDLRIAGVAAAARRYGAIARAAQLTAGACFGIADEATLRRRIAAARDARVAMYPQREQAIERDLERRGQEYIAAVAASEARLLEALGTDALAVLRDGRLAAAAVDFDEGFAKLGFQMPDADADAGGRKVLGAGGGVAAAAPANLPGYSLLSESGWSMRALAPFAPPCISRILDACFGNRHPTYVERTLVGSFMCRIEGLLADRDAFYAAWSSMFQHPEESCVLSKNPASFDKSRYGRAAADDARRCFARGKCFGCPHAMRSGLCPFFAGGGGGGPGGDAAGAKVRCIEDLRSRHGAAATRSTAVSSPGWYFRVAATAATRRAEQPKKC